MSEYSAKYVNDGYDDGLYAVFAPDGTYVRCYDTIADMLNERDTRIRELEAEVARLRPLAVALRESRRKWLPADLFWLVFEQKESTK